MAGVETQDSVRGQRNWVQLAREERDAHSISTKGIYTLQRPTCRTHQLLLWLQTSLHHHSKYNNTVSNDQLSELKCLDRTNFRIDLLTGGASCSLASYCWPPKKFWKIWACAVVVKKTSAADSMTSSNDNSLMTLWWAREKRPNRLKSDVEERVSIDLVVVSQVWRFYCGISYLSLACASQELKAKLILFFL